MHNYRMVVSYSEEKSLYVARAPDLEGCEVEAETGGEALEQLEEEINAQVAVIQEQGGEPPHPVDEAEFDGNLTLKVTPALHRDLAFAAKVERVELEVYLTEVLTRGASGRRPGGAKGRQRTEGRGRSRDGRGQRYHDIMENRADFIEYVRKLDGGGGGGGGRGGRGGRGRRGRGKERDKEGDQDD
jgi:predicted RNase H-like HicB family nuclease